ncbi:MAG: NapC/NirT family cytochrome c [Ignavibacteria bacterium]|nr:NapC/NirT family cytochrome c [Ignavibacteria bacterium]
MGEKEKKPLKEKKYFKNIRGFKRFLLFSGIYLFLFLLLFSAAAEYTSRPSFCPTCHYMETFYQSWRTSQHNKVDCVECHFEPGISGTIRGKLNGLVQIVNYVSLSYKKRKPWAEIPDNTCARSGCHEKQALQDSVYDFKGVKFNHKNHLQELRRGKTLKCTSCHSQIVQGTHMEVTESTCFNCHFKKSDDPEHKYDRLADCSTCHSWKGKTKEEMSLYRYDHTVVANNDISCLSCHASTVAGNGEVGKERCFQCHFENEKLEKFNDTEKMHETHIKKHSVKCYVCHTPIQHKVQKIDPNSPSDCISCHSNSHSSQVNLYTGEGGFEVEKTPSVMYLNGINCKGCHIFHETDKKDVVSTKAGSSSCEKCHGSGYDNLLKQWRTASEQRLQTINSIYRTVSSQVNNSKSSNKPEAEKTLDEAYHNIRIVETGKSVHNVLFADKLLTSAYSLMKKSLTMVGSSSGLPEFKSSSEFIPNECYNCHSGIQEISVKKFGMNFSHNLHIAKNKINCDKCHSNSQKHGELTVSKESCNNCHHSQSKNDESCVSCHKFQAEVYNGNYLNKKQPDIMKEAGASCVDCHIDGMKVNKPDNKICLKCHESGYETSMDDWKKDVSDQKAELSELLANAQNTELTNEQRDEVNEIRKIYNQINSYPSIYVHNYEMISTVLSDSRKKLKSFVK